MNTISPETVIPFTVKKRSRLGILIDIRKNKLLYVMLFPVLLYYVIFHYGPMYGAIIAIVLHMCSLRSFGVHYLSAVATPKMSELKDVLIRAPWWMMDKRPHFTGNYNEYRQSPGQKPGPERGDEA